MAKVLDNPRPTLKERAAKLGGQVQGSQVWNSIFRPGSIFRKGYTDSPRNRSYVIMNSVLYHLHSKGEASRSQSQLHAVSWWFEFLPLHLAHRHRNFLDVLLPTNRCKRVARHSDLADFSDFRFAHSQHASLGRTPHGVVSVLAHGACVLPRRIQTTS
ncbi:MAG: hypothetical protein RI898_189 [Actinomycetota bacterium]